jgi:hypothetical protein
MGLNQVTTGWSLRQRSGGFVMSVKDSIEMNSESLGDPKWVRVHVTDFVAPAWVGPQGTRQDKVASSCR